MPASFESVRVIHFVFVAFGKDFDGLVKFAVWDDHYTHGERVRFAYCTVFDGLRAVVVYGCRPVY